MVYKRMAEGGYSLPSEHIYRENSQVVSFKNLRSKATALSYWRRGLIEVLKNYEFDEAEGKKFLNFLLSNIRFAIVSGNEKGPGASVKILYNLVPSNLNLVSWRRILVGLNIVLEEPDTNDDIQMIGVFLPRKFNLAVYQEFCKLLELIKGCNWQVLHYILDLEEGHPLALLEILELCKDFGRTPESKQKNVRIFYEKDMFSMRQLGFYRANPSEPVTWIKPENNSHLTTISILNGLYGSLLTENCSSEQYHSFPLVR